MGILVSDNEERSKLQDRISADLRERAKRTSKNEDNEVDVDLVEDSAFIEDTKKSRGTSWFWITLVILAIISLGIIFFLR